MRQEIVRPITSISAGSSQEIKRPDRWRYQLTPYPKHYDRQLVFSLHEEDLKDTLTNDEYQQLGSVNVGTAKGWSFYIVERDRRLEGYNVVEWNIVKPLLDTAARVDTMVKQLVKKTFLLTVNNPHALEQATVRQGNELSEGERGILALRRTRIKHALKKITEKAPTKVITSELVSGSERESDGDVPTIAVVASGGGYRAMLGTVGSLVGMHDTGFLDVVSYMVGLSGSTWALAGLVTRDVTPAEFKDKLITFITQGLTRLDMHEARLIGEMLLLKYAYNQALTKVDIYGALSQHSCLEIFRTSVTRFIYHSK